MSTHEPITVQDLETHPMALDAVPEVVKTERLDSVLVEIGRAHV